MSYDFDGTDDYIEAESAVVTGAPLTMACWFNPDNIATNFIAMAISANTGTERHILQLAGGVAGDPVRAQTTAGGTTAQSATTAAFSASTWQHAAARFNAANNRRAYLNGVGAVANTLSLTPAGLNRTNIGCGWASNARAAYMNGLIAEAAIWNVGLNDDEIAALADGFRPSLIRPDALVLYAPLVREAADYRGGVSLTVSGALVADHTRRIG